MPLSGDTANELTLINQQLANKGFGPLSAGVTARAMGAGGTPGQDFGSWMRGIRQQKFDAAPRSQQFGMLKGLLRDTARSRGLKLTDQQASTEAHNFVRGLIDLGNEHQEAYSTLHDILQGVKDKQVNAPKGVFDPNAKQAPGESVFVPTPGSVDPALNRQNIGPAFQQNMDPNAPTPTDPAGKAVGNVLMGNLGAERLREASPSSWQIGHLGDEFPVNLVTGLKLPKRQRAGESGKMATDAQGAPYGAFQRLFQPTGKGDPLAESQKASKGGAIPWIVAEAYKHGVAGTVGGMATDPGVGANVFQQTVLQPYAQGQQKMLMQVADLYDRYNAGKGHKGNIKNPLTAYGITRTQLGLGPGDAITGDAIRSYALEKYGDGQRPGYFLTDPTRKDSFPALLDAGLKRIQSAQKAGKNIGGDTGALFGGGGGYLSGAAAGGMLSSGASASTADPSQVDPYGIVPQSP